MTEEKIKYIFDPSIPDFGKKMILDNLSKFIKEKDLFNNKKLDDFLTSRGIGISIQKEQDGYIYIIIKRKKHESQ